MYACCINPETLLFNINIFIKVFNKGAFYLVASLFWVNRELKLQQLRSGFEPFVFGFCCSIRSVRTMEPNPTVETFFIPILLFLQCLD